MQNKIQPMKKQSKITDAILTLVLLLYPLRKAWIGLDLMDAGYTLGNYRFFDTMNENWRLATYFANVLGVLLGKLPFGDTWVGMNVYTGLLIGIIACVTYRYLLKKQMGNRWLLFAGELLALSLCWAPTVNLYQYLGYLMMTIAAMLLYTAITSQKKGYFVIAGVILGAAVIVRMPNITYMALILPVWYSAWLYREKKEEATQDKTWLQTLLRQTGLCVGGYLIGLVPPLIYICIRYGIAAYPNMIASLFGMTDTATDYKPTSMVTAMLGDYIQYSVWLGLFLVCMLAGIVLGWIAKGRFEWAKKLLYMAGLGVLLRFCYGRGMFGLDYTSYFSMYKWVTVFLLAAIGLCIWLLMSKRAEKEHKLWAALGLVIIFVTPLGSNNGLYPIINNMFLIAPLTFVLLHQQLKRHCEGQNEIGSFAVKGIAVFLCIGVFVQSFLFGVCFVFHDTAKSPSDYERAQIQGSSSTKGLYTTVDKAAELDALGGYLIQNDLLQKEVILYGDIPAISYIFDMRCAVFSTWADLDSNSLVQLEKELESRELRDKKPLVILNTEAAKRLTEWEVQNAKAETEQTQKEQTSDKKLQAIGRYMTEMEYKNTFLSEQFYVYETP